MSSDLPYVVLVGDVGVGKSLLVEKITGEKGISSKADASDTRITKGYISSDKSFYISDTPGSNPIESKFEHNLNIAHALNFRPVSRIVLVVKADTRIDNVVDNARKYAESFADFDEFLTICITHIDTVDWEVEKCCRLIGQELGINSNIFSGLNVTPASLIVKFRALFIGDSTLDITITSDNFLKYFKIHNNNLKILKSTMREVREMEIIKQSFYNQQKQFAPADQVDLIFEFQAWIAEEIINAQKRVSSEHQFDFIGPETASQAGHIANMTNQMKLILYDIRTQVLSYQSNHDVNQMRKCPHCGLIWAKVEGCDGETTCGNSVSKVEGRGNFATFSFQRDRGNLSVTKIGHKTVIYDASRNTQKIGCGNKIEWKTMTPIKSPWLWDEPVVHTEDISQLPPTAHMGWINVFDFVWDKMANLF